ncbi:hypothetical protein Tco_0847853 [Tanacetum coccineum]
MTPPPHPLQKTRDPPSIYHCHQITLHPPRTTTTSSTPPRTPYLLTATAMVTHQTTASTDYGAKGAYGFKPPPNRVAFGRIRDAFSFVIYIIGLTHLRLGVADGSDGTERGYQGRSPQMLYSAAYRILGVLQNGIQSTGYSE